MGHYIENPKSKGSGIICCIPQKGHCPLSCEDCFFNTGRSYLEPLDENTPNVPGYHESLFNVVRVNDGGDSSVNRQEVMDVAAIYPQKFYNTSIPDFIDEFDAPVVLTVNPGSLTDKDFHKIPYQNKGNLMFVRVRVNTWNVSLTDLVVRYYSSREVPVILTFMAYFDRAVPERYRNDYVYRKRTLNSYWAITTEAWRKVMKRYENNRWVHSCGKIEGELGETKCKFCGNCLREYYATMERMRNE